MVGSERRRGLRRPSRWVMSLAAALATWLGGGRAEAQWAFWYNPFDVTPGSVDQIKQAALARIDAATRQQAGAPAAYVPDRPVTRDAEFFQKYDAETRRALENRVARRPSAPARATSRPGPAAPVPLAVPLASFFDRGRNLAWPADAPVRGDHGPRRTASDRASLAALDELDARGVASLATVAEARRRLVEYGKPALGDLVGRTTPRVADAFHLFLLSLYESLGQASASPGK